MLSDSLSKRKKQYQQHQITVNFFYDFQKISYLVIIDDAASTIIHLTLSSCCDHVNDIIVTELICFSLKSNIWHTGCNERQDVKMNLLPGTLYCSTSFRVTPLGWFNKALIFSALGAVVQPF